MRSITSRFGAEADVSGLEHYHHSPPPPLTGAARFMRGFGRIGAVLGIICFLVGLGVAFFVANEAANREIDASIQRQCIRAKFQQQGGKLPRRSYDQKEVDLYEAGCWGPYSSIDFNSLLTLQVEKRPEYLPLFLSPFFIGLSIALAIAFILYLGALTIGWILAGFTRF
jgi:hypothetical protein